MVGGNDPFNLKFWVNRSPWSEIADFEQIIARSASAVTPSERSSINTNRKSTMRFPMSPRWSSYVAPKSPNGGSKTQNGLFASKIALSLKKVCYKVSLCENCQQQSCRAFVVLTIHAKIIGGDVPFYLKFWVKVTALKRNRRFSIYFRHSASAVTSSEKSSIITNRKSTQKRKVSKMWTISCDNSATVRDRSSVTINP